LREALQAIDTLEANIDILLSEFMKETMTRTKVLGNIHMRKMKNWNVEIATTSRNRQLNARNIKGENTGQNTKMNYTPPITALSEIDF
jgi:hypothetical protein